MINYIEHVAKLWGGAYTAGGLLAVAGGSARGSIRGGGGKLVLCRDRQNYAKAARGRWLLVPGFPTGKLWKDATMPTTLC